VYLPWISLYFSSRISPYRSWISLYLSRISLYISSRISLYLSWISYTDLAVSLIQDFPVCFFLSSIFLSLCRHFSGQRISSVQDLPKFLIQDHSVFPLDFPVTFMNLLHGSRCISHPGFPRIFFFLFSYILHPGFFYLSVCISNGSLSSQISLYLP
jgi:hypothetical protein